MAIWVGLGADSPDSDTSEIKSVQPSWLSGKPV